MSSLKDQVIFITGASRGIGLEIALKAAKDGAKIAIAAKTDKPHPKLPGTIHTAAKAIEEAGGQALPLVVDVRDENAIQAGVEATVKQFGGIDILINNASAIQLTTTEATEMKRYDLMHQVNARGTFACSRACIPYLRKSNNPHILNNSPPLNMKPVWFGAHVAYTMAKYGMSMCALGMAAELADDGIAVNTIWPATAIATAATIMLGGEEMHQACRLPAIMADAVHAILTRPSRECTGNFFIDEEVLREEGITDFTHYAVNPAVEPVRDFFLD